MTADRPVTAAPRPPRVVGLGESLLRLSPPGHERLEAAAHLHLAVGGAEMNVLVGLRALGFDATWLTRLADNPLGRRIAAHAAAHGVDVRADWDPAARAPLYFVERGALPRAGEVFYDRAGSAMVGLSAATFDWPRLVGGAAAVVSSGITCALGEGPAAAVAALFGAARAAGTRTVFDVNHRSRLWSWAAAAPVLRPLLGSVDVLAASELDLARLLDRDGTAVELARAAIETFGTAIVLLRDSAASDPRTVTVTATAVTADAVQVSADHRAEVVDPLGAGDAALAAFVARLLREADLASAVDDAAWACAFQHTVPGDAWTIRTTDLARRGEPTRRLLR